MTGGEPCGCGGYLQMYRDAEGVYYECDRCGQLYERVADRPGPR